MRVPVTVLLALLALPPVAAPQPKAAKTNLAQQIEMTYVPTKLSGGRQVRQMGSVLIIQRGGIGALPVPAGLSFAGTFGSNYRDGRMRYDLLSNLASHDNPALRDLQIGETVYLLKVDVKDSSIVFEVQTCGPCDPNMPFPDSYRAAVTFPFKKGYLATMRFEEIMGTIGQVFSLAGQTPYPTDPPPQQPPLTDTAQPAYPPVPPTYPPAAPGNPLTPPDATAAPARIELGQTPAQVTAALGQPDKIVDLGSKKMFVYKDLKVTFVDGKVTDVQ